jgi:hypothetical protein
MARPQRGDHAGQRRARTAARLLFAAIGGRGVLAAAELTLSFGALPLFALVMGPGLLPSLKVVLDMGALFAAGFGAGRLGRPHAMIAAGVTAAGLAAFDLMPYVTLNVPWLVGLAANAVSDPRYLPSLLTTLAVHALMFGSLFAGAALSRPREGPTQVRLGD